MSKHDWAGLLLLVACCLFIGAFTEADIYLKRVLGVAGCGFLWWFYMIIPTKKEHDDEP